MAFTFTSSRFNTSVSGCGCGVSFQQKCWQIYGFGEKGTEQQICIHLFTPLYQIWIFVHCLTISSFCGESPGNSKPGMCGQENWTFAKK